MDLGTYVEQQERGALTRLQKSTGMSYAMLWKIATNGLRIKHYGVARRLSDATGGAVSIADLCEPLPEAVQRRLDKSRLDRARKKAAAKTAKAVKPAKSKRAAA